MDNIREFMEDDGKAFVYQRFIAPTSGSVRFAKARDRSVTGSINELVKSAKFWLEQDELSPYDIGFRLDDMRLSALASNKKGSCGKPEKAFKALADGVPSTNLYNRNAQEPWNQP